MTKRGLTAAWRSPGPRRYDWQRGAQDENTLGFQGHRMDMDPFDTRSHRFRDADPPGGWHFGTSDLEAPHGDGSGAEFLKEKVDRHDFRPVQNLERGVDWQRAGKGDNFVEGSGFDLTPNKHIKDVKFRPLGKVRLPGPSGVSRERECTRLACVFLLWQDRCVVLTI